jgi:hypothetical protein
MIAISQDILDILSVRVTLVSDVMAKIARTTTNVMDVVVIRLALMGYTGGTESASPCVVGATVQECK